MKEENGPLIALVVFIVLSLLFGYFAYDYHSKVVGDQQNGVPSMDEKIKEKVVVLDDMKLEIARLTTQASLLIQNIKSQQAEYQFQSGLFDDFTGEYNRRLALLDVAEKYSKQAEDISVAVTTLKNATLQRVNTDTTEVRDRMEKEVNVLVQDKEASVSRQRVLKEEFEVDNKKYRSSKNYEQTGLDDSKNILLNLTQRDIERAEVFTEPDGTVVLADVVSNLAIIDIGTAAGVKNGYRFECYALRPGHRKVIKGYLEVKKAGVSKSECIIVRRPVALPKDPLSDYVANQPEEMFSPYQESGRKGSSAQPLQGKPKMAILGSDPKDPIVEGDFIQNPFFDTKKSLTFYIAGAKEIQNERQKSAIRYRWTEIKAMIEAYGGSVSANADTNCNYMIAQKNPSEGNDQEKAEFVRAKDLGLPVIYEWELFRFLDTK